MCAPFPNNTRNVLTEDETAFLRAAIAEAEKAKGRGRHPFGSIVVDASGSVVARAGNNSMPPEGNPTQHAELRVVAAAFGVLGQNGMSTATLYSSAEPCVMCTGAAYWTGVGRIVYALSEPLLLTLTGDDPDNPTLSLPCRDVISRGQRKIDVVGPLLEDEAAAAHEGFWS
ncbi:nucleoside deaminase [Arthrobacter sp. Soil762]|uniref:nucleoside deaminase n=1 Tax=Arthrobacter sp. Soil762 TaxID=1736401 RepID=UPI0006F81AD1|nr:nucleoside deaminase [Arthrobacter sp. Soil762]KRE72718.1 cytidine deaminase [Arthrobacter sp. Soil762]